jgi:hypothetical protein
MASLTEVFGQDFSYYPMEPAGNQNGQNFQKKKKKNIRQKSYGHQMPPSQTQKFSSNEPKRSLNVNIGSLDSLDDQFLAINSVNGVNSEYGPTDYNIKPQDVQEYMFQLNDPNQTIKGAQVHNATNYIDTYATIPTNAPGNTPGNSNVFRPYNNSQQMSSNNGIVEEYDNDIDDDSDDDTDTLSKTQKQKQMPRTSHMMNMDMKMMEFNQKLDAIMEKLKHFDEPAQENIHDIILFVIFGCFVIFILDSVYRVGKMTL